MLTPNDPIVKKADSKLLRQALLDDQRHRLHAEAAPDAASASPYWKKWVAEYLEPTIPSISTLDQLKRDIVWPLVSNELVDDISDSAAAVHGAQDRYIAIELSDEKLQMDAEQYIERIDINGFVTRKCHNALFNAPNSLIVIDLPAEQKTDFPEPYPYLLRTDKIQKAEAASGPNKEGLMKFAYFDTDTRNQRALFDESDFAIFQKVDGSAEWKEILREPHNLGFCPAFKVWADVDDTNPLASNTLIRPSLGLLDRYIFGDGAMHSNDLKAAFANFWHMEEEARSCDYQTEEGYRCQNGYVEYPSLDGRGEIRADVEPIRRKCPRCKKKRPPGGPGGRIPIPVPKDKEDADLRPPAGWIDAPLLSLEYIQKKVAALRAQIRRTATGSEAGPQNDQALNESQILSILEAARQVGEYLAEYFEITHKRILDGVLRLRYGAAYIGCTVNYGRRFAALSGDLLMKLYEMAQGIGSPWLLEEIDGMLQDYYARSDSSRALRFKLINKLNPYPFMSPEQLSTIGIDLLDPKGYALSVGLMGFINRFERDESIPIERFGIQTPFSNRVSQILDSLKSYVDEIEPAKPPTSDPASGGNPNPRSGKSGQPNPANRKPAGAGK
ncbi:hypothetical protein [Spirosoma foliorum]|uniref:Uncharacterized protein n=1 Tax=Spirosoma foliorum TaxID=2710596 RepID=A0A7G5H5I8_9BACT|nr:hypothetical protein [Spirosoma foliorum]QMW06380.1 hypothetical protein H3H32_16555 [Spirosoma foliorum]